MSIFNLEYINEFFENKSIISGYYCTFSSKDRVEKYKNFSKDLISSTQKEAFNTFIKYNKEQTSELPNMKVHIYNLKCKLNNN